MNERVQLFGEMDGPANLDMRHSITELRDGLIGSKLHIEAPFGRKRIVYADYTVSGRALTQVEDWIRNNALPYYANSHTEVSACGQRMNRLRRQARTRIAASVGAGSECDVIFCGSGATAAANRLLHLLGLRSNGGGETQSASGPIVLTGPYEHLSNILPWREAGARTVEIAEAAGGGVDLDDLQRNLRLYAGQGPVIGVFSAASNVTGILTDVRAVTRLLKAHGALAVWDYACGAPYLPMTMDPARDAPIDALFYSSHKFPGGPGGSGVLVIRRDAVRTRRPTCPGGGSVSYVSGWAHDYYDDLVLKEEAGTPDILGDLRAALAIAVRDGVGTDVINRRGQRFLERALAVWRKNERIVLLGHPTAKRLPIIAFLLRDADGGIVHHRLVTRLLSDLFGIQAREGCSCAGPYGHRLLDVDRTLSESIRQQIHAGRILAKPGWTRLNFCHLLDDQSADHIIEAVAHLPDAADRLASQYRADPATGNFYHINTFGSAARQTHEHRQQEAV